MEVESKTTTTSHSLRRNFLAIELLAGLLPPLVAFSLQWLLRHWIHPHVWYLFFPAVFVSSWLGTRRSGLLATAVSVAIVWWFFLPPELSLAIEPKQYFPIFVFILTGVSFAFFHEQLRKTIEMLKQAVQQRQIFAALIENSSDFIGITDPNGKPVYLNPAGRHMVGLAADYPITHTQILEYYPSEVRPFAADVIVKAMVEFGRWNGETCFRNWQTGASIPVSDEHFMIREPGTGRVLGMGTVTRDISDIKRARDDIERSNRELQRANELISNLLELAPDAIFIADLEGRYTSVNNAACRMLGYSREELLRMRVLDLIPPDDLERLVRTREEQLKGHVQFGEWALLRKDGSRLPTEISSHILPNGRWQAFVRDISERNRAEEALRVSEAKFSGIVSISADAIISIDEQQHITMFNEGAEKIFGYARAEVIGAPLNVLISERYRAMHSREVERFAAGPQAARRMGERGARIFGRRKNGEEFPADAAISKLEIGGSRILTVALRDISEQMKAQEQLRLSQERFELALKGADLAAWDWNVKTGEVIFNARWAEMRGYHPDEIVPRVETWTSGVHPDDMPRVQKELESYFKGAASEYETEHRVRTKSGNWIWVLDRGKVFARDEKGHPIRMAGTELDITDRKNVENEMNFLADIGPQMAASLDYDETLASVARLAVRNLADFCIIDLIEENGKIKRKKVACRDQSKDWICDGLMKIDLDHKRLTLTREAMARQRPKLMEHVDSEDVARYAQNEEHLRLLRAAEIQSVISVPLSIREKSLGAIALISSSRIYTVENLRFAEEIARRAALSIDNAQLYRTAERAIQTRDDVLGIVAHDLRNPLGIILMQTALLQRRGEEPERRRRAPLEAIGRSAARMNRLIQDLLDVSRMEAGRLPIEPARVQVAPLLADALDAQRLLASTANLDLRVEVAPELPEVWVDRNRLLQVFENLIGNAIKFTAPGGRITVRAAQCMDEIEFQVADTGSGIPFENLPHIFDRFWQAKRTRQGGAGLGLSIAKGIVEAHEGHIWAESTPGKGTTFYFTLPAASAVKPAR